MRSSVISILIGSIVALVAATAAADGRAMVSEGRSLRLQGNTVAAEQKLKSALQTEPGNYLATYNLGLTYLQAGKKDQAITTLEEAVRLREKTGATDYTIYNTLGWVYLQDGDTANAEQQFVEGMKHKDKLSAASRARLENNLGLVYFSKGELTRAEPLFTQAAQAGNALAKENLELLNTVKRNVAVMQSQRVQQKVPAAPVKPR